MNQPNPQHVEIAKKLEDAFRQTLPKGFRVVALVIDTTQGEPPFPMFVTRTLPIEAAREVAAAFAGGVAERTIATSEIALGQSNFQNLKDVSDDELRQTYEGALAETMPDNPAERALLVGVLNACHAELVQRGIKCDAPPAG